jgi:putative tryptophan/tyrosine transport system substrate-binding protein
MNRREFIAGLGSAVAWPLVARAQHVSVIGYLDVGSPEVDRRSEVASMRGGLMETGYVEGRNLTIEYRWAENHDDRLPGLAAELVRRQVAVIVTSSTPAALAAKSATKTIPVVFFIGADPVKFGLVARMNRPGENLTGISNLTNDLEAKKLQFLSELVPKGALIAMLVNPANPNAEFDTADAQAATQRLGTKLLILRARVQSDIEGSFATLVQHHAAALLVSSDALFNGAGDQLIALAARHRVPAIYSPQRFTHRGGLMSYGAGGWDPYKELGIYAGRILNGEKPADLPVQQATKIQLVINLKTATALGLTLPPSILLRADEVIE